MQIFKKKQHVIISYLVITLGILIYTFGWAAVMLPAKIVGGGVSGISSVLYYALGLHIPIGVMNLVINAVHRDVVALLHSLAAGAACGDAL